MEIRPTDSSELATREYREIMPGAYACPESGRVLIIADNDTGLLILTEEKK